MRTHRIDIDGMLADIGLPVEEHSIRRANAWPHSSEKPDNQVV